MSDGVNISALTKLTALFADSLDMEFEPGETTTRTLWRDAKPHRQRIVAIGRCHNGQDGFVVTTGEE